MYIFKIFDKNIPKASAANPTKTTAAVIEFTEIAKQEEGFDKKKFREIKKSKKQINSRKPMNVFMMFRAVVKQMILKNIPNGSFSDISKISSILWSNRSDDLDHYMKYLAKQEEICQSEEPIKLQLRRKQIKKQKARFGENDEKTRTIVERETIGSSKKKSFKHYKIKKPNPTVKKTITKKRLKPDLRIEDIYIYTEN